MIGPEKIIMLDDTYVLNLINESEWLMEGLDKNFWRLIKLSEPEIWENENESGSEYLWVVAVMGNWCIFYSDSGDGFCTGRYEVNGAVEESYGNPSKLHYLVSEIVSSRFKIG